jgi:hypothetical protein
MARHQDRYDVELSDMGAGLVLEEL